MAFNANVSYNDLPPLPPEVDVETKSILKQTIAARSALAELKGLGETIPSRRRIGKETLYLNTGLYDLLSR